VQLTDPLTIFFFLVGLLCGSFGNVLVYRLPQGQSVCGRSKCPHCKKQIEPRDLVPLLSFLLLRGRCRSCHELISLQYPLVEFGSGILFIIALIVAPGNVAIAFLLALVLWLLFIIALIDAQTQGIPDVLNAPFILLAGLYAFLTGNFSYIGPLIAAGFFLAQWRLSSGRWVGSGDIFLALGIGLLIGDVPRVLCMLGASYIIGAVVAGFLLWTGKKTRQNYLPFGPYE